jgi:hypothetical protein
VIYWFQPLSLECDILVSSLCFFKCNLCRCYSDALGNHKRGESRRAEHVRPVGQVLLRMMIQGSPVAKRGAKMMTAEELAAGAVGLCTLQSS